MAKRKVDSVILFSFQPDFIPIIKELKNYEITTMHPNFTKMLADIDISAKSLSDFMTRENYEFGNLIAAKKIAEYDRDYKQIGFTGAEEQEWINEKALSYFYSRFDDIAGILLTLDEMNPSVIVLHNDVEPMTRVLALWAKKNSKPCLHVPHAVYLENGGRGGIGTDIHDMISASHVVTCGPYQTNWFAQRGMHTDNIYLTGLPQFDKLYNRKFNRNSACTVLGLTTQRPVVTYMSSWRQDTSLLSCHDGVEESYLAFLETAKQLEDIQFIVKCHPRGNNTKQHADLAKEKGVRCIVLQDHLEPCIAASNAVISYGASNVVLETATYGTTNIIVVGDDKAFPKDDEIIKCNPENLTDAVKFSLSNPVQDYSEFLRKYFYRIDGNNYLRIAELIRRLHN